MFSNLIKMVVVTAGVVFSSVAANAQEIARVNSRTPSIVYYGNALNQKVDEKQYLASQEQYSSSPEYIGSQRQGRHLTDMEEARRRGYATGYGAISEATGNARTTYVSGYTKSDGSYVRPYYKSKRRR